MDRRVSGSGSSFTPVFVLGVQRSGTTWLGNILAQHSRAAAVQAPDHFGIHESIFFSHFARAYGDLAGDANFACFASEFTRSDYYVLTGLEPEWLEERRPRSYPDAFRAVMDEFADRDGRARIWIEKSPHHTLLADRLEAAFPDARFVGIVRNPTAVVASTLRMGEPRPPTYPARLGRVVRLAAKCSLYQGWLERFSRGRANCLLTRYERLAADPAAEVRRICDFLELEFEPAMLELPWPRNTSFGEAESRHPTLEAFQALVVRATTALMRPVPVTGRRERELRRLDRRGIDWPEWCWRRLDRRPPGKAATRALVPARGDAAPGRRSYEATARG